MRRPLLLAGLVTAAFACCAEPSAPTKKPLRVVDLGDAQIATLYDDGSYVVTRDGAPLLGSPPGRALVARFTDPESIDAWHDPEKADHTAFTAVPPASITF